MATCLYLMAPNDSTRWIRRCSRCAPLRKMLSCGKHVRWRTKLARPLDRERILRIHLPQAWRRLGMATEWLRMSPGWPPGGQKLGNRVASSVESYTNGTLKKQNGRVDCLLSENRPSRFMLLKLPSLGSHVRSWHNAVSAWRHL